MDAVATTWETYVAGGEPIVRAPIGKGNNETSLDFEVSHPNGAAADNDPTSLAYPTQYFSAANADDLNDAFKQIASLITETAKIPTEESGEANGSIIYTDPIGEYMEVKDVKSIIFGGEQFTNPTVSGQGSDTLTYTFSGSIDSPVYGTHNVSEISITVKTTTNADGTKTQVLTVDIPATTIPIRLTSVTKNADGSIETSTSNAYPLRILYAVGLQDGVLDANGQLTDVVTDEYVKSHQVNGKVAFYSNLYDGTTVDDTTVGDATVTFQPADDNPFYFVQSDIALFLDEACSEPATEYDPNATYYFKITYYEANQEREATVSRSADLMNGYTHVSGGQLYLSAGAPRLGNLLDFAQQDKGGNNLSGTASSNYYPTFSGDVATGSFTVYLGNNGRLLADRATGSLAISKTVSAQPGDVAPATDEFTFTVELANAQGTALPDTDVFTYALTDSATGDPVTDGQGQPVTGTIATGGTVTLKAGQTATIQGLPDGTKFTVTETARAGYGNTTVSLDGAEAVAGTSTSGAIDAAKDMGSTVAFTNTYAPESGTLDGQVALGVSKTFTGRTTDGTEKFTFEISGSGVASDGITGIEAPMPSDGEGNSATTIEITIPASGDGTSSSASGSFGTITFTRPGTYTYEIREVVPSQGDQDYLENVEYSTQWYTVTVVVSDNGTGKLSASVTKYTQHATADDATGTDFSYAPAGMGFVNTYVPDPVSIVIQGTKTLENKTLAAGAFEFELSAITVDGVTYSEENGNVDQLPVGTPTPMLNAGTAEEQALGIGSTVTNGATGDASAIEFGSLSFGADTVGHTYVYTFTEVVDGATQDVNTGTWTLNGVTYDTSVKTVTVSPVQGSDGTITAVPSYASDGGQTNGLAWENTYAASTQVVIAGTKVLENKDLASSGLEFGFVLEGTDGDPTLLTANTSAGDASGAFSFAPISYDQSDMDGASVGPDGVTRTKVITYTVSEVGAGTTDSNGISYDGRAYTVTVTLTDDGQGNMTASPSYSADGQPAPDGIVFKNTYEPRDATLDGSTYLTVAKTFEGRTVNSERFVFEISGTGVSSDGAAITAPLPADAQGQPSSTLEVVMPTASSTSTTSFRRFGTITFTQEGTYTYEIREVVPSQGDQDYLENVEYSTAYYVVTVEVEDDGAGQLVATPSYRYYASDQDATGEDWTYDPSVGMEFTNTYVPSPVSVDIQGTKTLENDTLTAGTFEFKLASVTVDNVEYDESNAGELPAGTPLPMLTDGTTLGIGSTVVNGVGTNAGTIAFGAVTFDAATVNHTYTYTFEEVIPDGAVQAEDGTWVLNGVSYDPISSQSVSFAPTRSSDGIISATAVYDGNATSGLAWTNTYSTTPGTLVGSTNLQVTKAIDGRPWNANDTFTFEITDEGNTAGLTANPMPSETTVNLSSANLVDQPDGSQLAVSSFGNIEYAVPGVYTYGISEQGTDGNGMTVSKATYEVEVNVEDNGNGALTVTSTTTQLKDDLGSDLTAQSVENGVAAFVNTYATNDAQAVVSGTKVLENKDLASSGLEFGFVLEGTDGDPTLLTANTSAGDASGAFSFAPISYDQSDMDGASVGPDGVTRTKVITYTVSEVGAGTTDGNGITYSDARYNVYVTLTDDGAGTLTADVSYDDGITGLVFSNTYAAHATAQAVIDITKKLTGKDMAADTFSFLVKDANGTTVASASNGQASSGEEATSQAVISYGISTINDADPSIVVTDPNTGVRSVTLYYTVSELNGDSATPIDGVTYDPVTYDISVTVTDNGDGTMSAVTGYPDGMSSLYFENSYATSGEFQPVGSKTTVIPDGATPSTDEFSFEVVDNDTGDVVALGTSGLNGAISFGKITISSAGEHSYTIREVCGGLTSGGITYDGRSYTLVVEMGDLGNGQLEEVAHAYYDEAGNEVAQADFENTYSGTGTSVDLSVELPASKQLIGNKLSAGDFSFEVTDENGVLVAGGTNGADGTIDLGSISYFYTVEQPDQSTMTESDTQDSSEASDADVTSGAEGADGATDDNPADSSADTGTQTETGTGNELAMPGEGTDVTEPSAGDEATGEGGATDAPTGEGAAADATEPSASDTPATPDESLPVDGLTGEAAATDGSAAVTEEEVAQQEQPIEEAQGLSLEGLLAPTTAIADDQGAELYSAPDPVASTDVTDAAVDASDQASTAPQVVSSDLGTHYYFLREVIPSDAVYDAQSGTYVLDGVKYDLTIYRFSVTVTDNGDGTMSADVDDLIVRIATDGTETPVNPEGVTFVNSYEPTNPAKVDLEGTKTLTGRDMTTGEFTFEVRDAITGDIMTTGTSTAAADGQAAPINFVEFTYDVAGEYDLVVSEVQGDSDATGVSYDTRSFEVHVSVADDGLGNLVATVTYAQPIAFENTYQEVEKSTSVTIEATKTLTGRDMVAGEFSFAVVDPVTDEVKATGQSPSAADGEQVPVTFTEIWYDSVGEYEYVVTENAGSDGTIAYDTTTYRVWVFVAENEDGTLTATVDYPDGTPAFANSYMPEEPGDNPGPAWW